MLGQGHMGLLLHIFHEMKYFLPVIFKIHVDGAIETLPFSNFYIDWKIWCLEDPLVISGFYSVLIITMNK